MYLIKLNADYEQKDVHWQVAKYEEKKYTYFFWN